MYSTGYWISERGAILELSGYDHINQIINAPSKFFTTLEEIKSIYAKYNEPLGKEGLAREEIIINAIKKGFIRIRLYANKQWSVNLWNFGNREKKSLAIWAEEAKKDRFSGPYMPVYIYAMKTDEVIKDFTVNDIYYEKHLTESVKFESFFVPRIVKSIKEFDDLPVKYLTYL
jgi:hypothetical protein